MQRVLTFARFATFPENRSARLAIDDLTASLTQCRPPKAPDPVLLHGPPGTGKTHLVSALVTEVSQRRDLTVICLAASDLRELAQGAPASSAINEAPPAVPEFNGAGQAGLFVLEDLQHLPPTVAERLTAILDQRAARGLPTVFTASHGPRDLTHRGQPVPARLSSRLAAGLVVALRPLGPGSRASLLQDFAQRRQLAIAGEIIRWLAERLTGGGRQLEGAITHLAALTKASRGRIDLDTVARHFGAQAEANRPTVESIASRVSGYFRIKPAALRSTSRQRGVLWPRQISMYLARKLTKSSLQQIGAFFGGRDHTTVLHACRKVEEAKKADAVVSAALRDLQASLC